MSLPSLPRPSTMLQSSAIPYGAHQFATGQYPRRRPTIGAPDITVAPEPSANLKRRSHIRRPSRSGVSPTESGFTAASERPAAGTSKPLLTPLVTAFTRTITTSSTTTSAATRRPTLMEPSTVEWRDSPRYQPNVTARAELSRRCAALLLMVFVDLLIWYLYRSTTASVYSLPSAGPHQSRQSTQENYVVDWSFVDRALQNRSRVPISPSNSSRGLTHLPAPSNAPNLPHENSHSWGPADVTRSNTAHVRALLRDRRSRYSRLPELPQ
jgi:hypothetical protein